MKNIIISLLLTFLSFQARAASEIKVDADLVVHPDQLSQFFTLASEKISSTPQWTWSALSFAKPYKTSWSNIAAQGPFNIRFETSSLNKQEIGFELDWAEPTVQIGRFAIHDTITRQVGGLNLIINLNGACNNMSVKIPAGSWKLKGRINWTFEGAGLQVSWKDFAFSANASAVPQIDLGQCQGANAIQQELKKAIDLATRDQVWLQELIKEGALDWIAGSPKRSSGRVS